MTRIPQPPQCSGAKPLSAVDLCVVAPVRRGRSLFQLRTRAEQPRRRLGLPASAHPHPERLPAGTRRPQRIEAVRRRAEEISFVAMSKPKLRLFFGTVKS